MDKPSSESRELQPFEKQQQSRELVIADPASIAAAETAKQRIQAAYIMAHHNPRNVEQARQNILSACKRPKFAELAQYSKPIGDNDAITGPSIRLAEHCLREYGNIDCDISVVYEDNNIRRVKVHLTDLQTIAHFNKEISITKTVERKNKKGRDVLGERLNKWGDTVYIVVATEDEMQMKEAAAISKVIRNEGLRLIPADIVDEALEVARQTREGNIKEDPIAYARKIIDSFDAMGVKAAQLEKYLGHPVQESNPTELDRLRAMHTSMKSDGVPWSDLTDQSSEGEVAVKKAPTTKKATSKAAKKVAAAKEAEEKEDLSTAEPNTSSEPPPVTNEPQVSQRTELENLCLDAKVEWTKVEAWAQARQLDLSKDEDCQTVIDNWEGVKEVICNS